VSNSAPIQSRSRLIRALQEQIARLERGRRPAGDEAVVPSGCEALDRLLPQGGFRRGTLVEWLAAGDGSGSQTLAFYTVREACQEGGAVVVLDRAREFYPPAAARLGIPPDQLIVVCARNPADNTWALDQALRCPAVAAVVAWPEKLDGHTFRRLQLAAEQGGGLGVLIRPERVRHEPSWAAVRLLVEPLPCAAPDAPRRLKVHVLRRPDHATGGSVEVEIDDETHPLHPTRKLARPADPRRAAGA
jgi:protein ImuA